MSDDPEHDSSFSPQLAPRFSEIDTFMRAPLSRYVEGGDIVLVRVPFDARFANRTGARHGLCEVRNSSAMIRAIHLVTRIDSFELCQVVDADDVRFTQLYGIEKAEGAFAAYLPKIHDADALPLAPGGVRTLRVSRDCSRKKRVQ